MARTYLERHLEEFADSGREELIKHGLRALKESMAQDKELTVDNTSVGVIGTVLEGKRKGKVDAFRLYDGAEIGPLLEASFAGPGHTETHPQTGTVGTTDEGAVAGETMDVDT